MLRQRRSAPPGAQRALAQQHRRCRPLRASPFFTTDSVTARPFQEEDYRQQQQHEARTAWASNVRRATGRTHHIAWAPQLEPPCLLDCVSVVLVAPKKPISVGTAARACSCFETTDLRIVRPRCEPNTRSSRSVSKGAQWLLWRAACFDTLPAALGDAGSDLSVALTRWPVPGQAHLAGVPQLLQHPLVLEALAQPFSSSLDPAQPPEQAPPRRRITLVFGREESGLSDAEVAACDVACSVSCGRLQESLSLSHAVTVVLSQLFQARLDATAGAEGAAALHVSGPEQLAAGYDAGSGGEH